MGGFLLASFSMRDLRCSMTRRMSLADQADASSMEGNLGLAVQGILELEDRSVRISRAPRLAKA